MLFLTIMSSKNAVTSFYQPFSLLKTALNGTWPGNSPMQPFFIHSCHGSVKNYVSLGKFISASSTDSPGHAFLPTCSVHGTVPKVYYCYVY